MLADMARGKVANTGTAVRPRERAGARSRPTRPTNLPQGRWLGDFPNLGEAEEKLIVACARGEWCWLGGEVPDESTEANRIRAELIRFLLLAGDDKHPVHEAGVQIHGAWIEGDLELDMVHAGGPL